MQTLSSESVSPGSYMVERETGALQLNLGAFIFVST